MAEFFQGNLFAQLLYLFVAVFSVLTPLGWEGLESGERRGRKEGRGKWGGGEGREEIIAQGLYTILAHYVARLHLLYNYVASVLNSFFAEHDILSGLESYCHL